MQGSLASCRYCGATITLHGAAPAPVPSPPMAALGNEAVFLEDAGANKIGVIKVVREHTGLGLREAKDLVDQTPCMVTPSSTDPRRFGTLRSELVKAGARVR